MNESQSNSFLAEQPVGALMRKFSLPCILSLLVGALYNIVDQLFIANASYLGSYGNAANSVVFPLTVIALAIATMIGDGCCAYVSIRLGAGEPEKAHRSVGNAIVLTLIVSVMLMAVYLIFMDPILTAFGATVNAETFAHAREYCFWIALGIPFYMFGQAMNPIIRSDGSPRYAMLSLLAGAVCNIVLDPILIFGLLGFPRMEVAGAAVATIVGQFVGAGLGLFLNLKKNPEVQIHLKNIRPHRATVADIYAIGIPSIIMQSIGSVMMFGMNKILISFTEAATAVFGAYFKLQSFIFMPCFGLNNAMVPIVSYNYGAQKFDRVRKTVRLTVFTAIGIMCVGCALFELIPETLLGMFSPTDEMLSIGRVALRIIGVHFPLAGFSIIAGSACQALGKPIYALINSVCRQIVVLLPAAYLLSLTGRLELVWLAFPIAEVVSVILNATFLRLTYRVSLERK